MRYFQQSPYNLAHSAPLQRYLRQLPSIVLDEKEQYKRSLEVEPRGWTPPPAAAQAAGGHPQARALAGGAGLGLGGFMRRGSAPSTVAAAPSPRSAHPLELRATTGSTAAPPLPSPTAKASPRRGTWGPTSSASPAQRALAASAGHSPGDGTPRGGTVTLYSTNL